MNNVLKIDGSNFDDEIIQQAPREDVIVFENEGELDIRAIKTMGISAKDKVNPIGFFGTGLKYALAILMREGQTIVVNSGLNKYTFEKKQVEFRGKDFEVITMNDFELPFTTELGKTWEMWQAYRELHCNTIDENGKVYRAFNHIEGVSGKTIITVSGAAFNKAFDERKVVVLDTPAWGGDSNVQIHNGHSHHLYYRGIRIQDILHSIYTYNLLMHTELTEDRTIRNWWKGRGAVINMILASDNREFLKRVLTAQELTYENDFNYLDASEATSSPSPAFLAVVEELYSKVDVKLNESAIALWKKHCHANDDGLRNVVELTVVQQAQLQKAISFAEKIGFKVTEYPIVVTDSMDQSVLGLGENHKIFLSLRAFSRGAKAIATVLIEEFIHLKHDLDDESRAMQNFLFETIVDLGAELHQEVL